MHSYSFPPSKKSTLPLYPIKSKEKLSLEMKISPSHILQTPPKLSKNIEQIRIVKRIKEENKLEEVHPPLPWLCSDIGDGNSVADCDGGTGMDGDVDGHPVGSDDDDEGDGVGSCGRGCLRWW